MTEPLSYVLVAILVFSFLIMLACAMWECFEKDE